MLTSKGLNRHITCLSACRPLNEYAWLVEEIRRNMAAGLELDKAVDGAIDNIPLRAFGSQWYVFGTLTFWHIT